VELNACWGHSTSHMEISKGENLMEVKALSKRELGKLGRLIGRTHATIGREMGCEVSFEPEKREKETRMFFSLGGKRNSSVGESELLDHRSQ